MLPWLSEAMLPIQRQGTVGLVGALLAKRPASWGPALQFEPAYACHRIRVDRKVVKQRLATVWKSAISVAEHQPVNKAAQRVRYASIEARSLR